MPGEGSIVVPADLAFDHWLHKLVRRLGDTSQKDC